MTTILIVDPHPIVRYGLQARFSMEAGVEVVGEAADGLAALALVNALAPDLIVLDLQLPQMDGLTVLRAMKEARNPAKSLLLTASKDREQFVEALRLGCCGIVDKQLVSDAIVECVRRVKCGEVWTAPGAAAFLNRFAGPKPRRERAVRNIEGGLGKLSNREREVVACIAHGLNNKQISERLSIGVQTVKNYVLTVLNKLCLSDRVELALFTLIDGLHMNATAANCGPVPVVHVVVADAEDKLSKGSTAGGVVMADLASPAASEQLSV